MTELTTIMGNLVTQASSVMSEFVNPPLIYFVGLALTGSVAGLCVRLIRTRGFRRGRRRR